jgi:2-oxoglutarate dehydrogenase E2 component (dihydrolipoamide succinyltransferase)
MEYQFKMPKMGESIQEATIINWLKKVGDFVDFEEIILEVATDKVDTEVPSPIAGIITEIFFHKDAVVEVGSVLATISPLAPEGGTLKIVDIDVDKIEENNRVKNKKSIYNAIPSPSDRKNGAFLSPLIISIAQKENLSIEELQTINGSGADGRIQKSDVYEYLKNRKYPVKSIPQPTTDNRQPTTFTTPKINFIEGKDSIVEMDRMRTMIANHMVYSKQTSPHVTSFIEVDVTDLVNWRNENKDVFLAQHGEKLTFTPFFVDAVAKAIVDFPMINVSVDGKKIIVHKDINIGMATALPSGNLIVPVVKKANEKTLSELAKTVNQLAESSRKNKLKPDEIQGSTFTISNVGTFGSLMGTPIINQPEVAILAFGIIKKRPEVITTEKGDEIAIRSMMYLSLSFDHRVVDGFLGGSFLRKVGDYLENFKY